MSRVRFTAQRSMLRAWDSFDMRGSRHRSMKKHERSLLLHRSEEANSSSTALPEWCG